MQRKSFAKKSRQMKNGISYFNIKKTIQCLKQAKQDKNHRKNKRKTHFYDDKSESFLYLICATPKPCIHHTGQSRFKRPLFLAKVGSGGNTPRTINTISGKFSCGSLPQIMLIWVFHKILPEIPWLISPVTALLIHQQEKGLKTQLSR